MKSLKDYYYGNNRMNNDEYPQNNILKHKIFKNILFPNLKISTNVMKRVVNDLYEYVRNNKNDGLNSNENLLFIYGNISFDIYFDIIFKHNKIYM